MRKHFGRLPADFATYALNDADAAVRLASTAPRVAMDIETGSARSVRRWDVKAFSISDTARSYVLDPAFHGDAIRECVRRADRIVFHNAAYDVPIMYAAGLLRSVDIEKVDDTLISARIAWPDVTDSNRLGPLADRVLGGQYGVLKSALEDGFKDINPRESKSAMFDRLGIDSQAYVAYAAFDAIVTLRIYAAMTGVLSERMNPGLPGFRPCEAGYINDREQAVNRMLLRRSAVGITLDDDAAEEVVTMLRREANLHRKVLEANGIDPDLGGAEIKRQLVDALDTQGLLPASWPVLKSGKRTTSRIWMERLDDSPVAQAAMHMAQAERFIKDYRDGSAQLSYRGRIYPQVGVAATVTGRMTYSNPNLQQYPPAVRRMFAFDQPITSFDWSSIEPVVIANLSGAAGMLADFEAGGDLYMPIAQRAGVDRKTAKTVLLAMLYGQGVASLALRLGVAEERAREFRQAIRAAMPEVTRTLRRITAYGEQYGAIQTVSGRVVPLPPDPKTANERFKGYKGANYIVQGSAYDLLAEALYALHREGMGDSVALAIHDELVVHTEVADDVERIMLTPPQALIDAAGRVPMLRVGRADLGTHWEAKDD